MPKLAVLDRTTARTFKKIEIYIIVIKVPQSSSDEELLEEESAESLPAPLPGSPRLDELLLGGALFISPPLHTAGLSACLSGGSWECGADDDSAELSEDESSCSAEERIKRGTHHSRPVRPTSPPYTMKLVVVNINRLPCFHRCPLAGKNKVKNPEGEEEPRTLDTSCIHMEMTHFT